MGDRRWEWDLPGGGTLAASVDERSRVESVWLGDRLVSRSGPRGKAEGHAVAIPRDERSASAVVTFEGARACTLVVDGERREPRLSPPANAALASERSSANVDGGGQRLLFRAALVAAIPTALFFGVRRVVRSAAHDATATAIAAASATTGVLPPEVSAAPTFAGVPVTLSEDTTAPFDAGPPRVLAGRLPVDVVEPAPATTTTTTEPLPGASPRRPPPVATIPAKPVALEDGVTQQDCIRVGRRHVERGGVYDHVVRVTNRCVHPATCRVSEEHGPFQIVGVGPGAVTEIVTSTNQSFSIFDARVNCQMILTSP